MCTPGCMQVCCVCKQMHTSAVKGRMVKESAKFMRNVRCVVDKDVFLGLLKVGIQMYACAHSPLKKKSWPWIRKAL